MPHKRFFACQRNLYKQIRSLCSVGDAFKTLQCKEFLEQDLAIGHPRSPIFPSFQQLDCLHKCMKNTPQKTACTI